PPAAIYPLPLHDALPISQAAARHPRAERRGGDAGGVGGEARLVHPDGLAGLDRQAEDVAVGVRAADLEAAPAAAPPLGARAGAQDRKSTRLNSSHDQISY